MTHQSIYFGLARREVEAIFIQVELAGIGQGVYFAVSYFTRVVFGFVHIVSSRTHFCTSSFTGDAVGLYQGEILRTLSHPRGASAGLVEMSQKSCKRVSPAMTSRTPDRVNPSTWSVALSPLLNCAPNV